MNLTSQPMTMMSREELMKIIDTKYQRRTFIAADIKDYVCSLPPEKAFALSKLLPAEVLDKVLSMRGTDVFADNIIEYAQSISKDGKPDEVISKQAVELFLVTHSNDLLHVIGG